MKKVLFILLFIFLLPVVCFSGEYRLLEGKKEDVCKAYLKNLNSFRNWPLMACERSFNEHIPYLKGIDWQPTWTRDVNENKTTILNKDAWDKILTFVDPDNYPRRGKYDFLGYSIRKAEIDIDNDGVLETIYRPEISLCKSSHYYATYIVVFDENKNDINISKTKKLLGSAIHDTGISNGVMFDAFTYKGKTYFDMWDDRGFEKDPKTLTVYLFKDNQIQKKCVYQHRNKSK